MTVLCCHCISTNTIPVKYVFFPWLLKNRFSEAWMCHQDNFNPHLKNFRRDETLFFHAKPKWSHPQLIQVENSVLDIVQVCHINSQEGHGIWRTSLSRSSSHWSYHMYSLNGGIVILKDAVRNVAIGEDDCWSIN